ncbi:tRNA lysidine(34) synthetase TilS [Wolbachia endosymbiont of Ctenocephalides felis wCfeT]|uniref:tRNA lysidine(34) synthetase TilS n=1 Tax=Wolbachia endosymbiont of Ctenocephalides felis wCfeT TaxID=2732593 RepID=UPI001447B707|nr:tRNA lysidine(34) synthetase TilS [Wolbachia endosymbiont of Ctenocephalides felis wCfeT]
MKLESLLKNNFIADKDRVAIAVSGGIDSIVLLHLVINLSIEHVVLTVDHSLRPESKKETEFVINYAKELGAKESYILSWKRDSIKGNIQAQARKARYQLLTEWCKKNGVEYLLVAHHKDDQAETFLLRLERGSGIDGLSSMDCKSFLNGVCILRPLLNFNRNDIEKYANFHQLNWIEDRSNQDLKYKRTLYRNLLKASDNQEVLTERVCLTALHMKRAAKALAHYTHMAFNDCVNMHDFGYIEIKLSKFYELPEEIALRLLLYSIMAVGNKHYKPRYCKLIAIFNEIVQKDSNVNRTLSGCKIRKYEESILIIREAAKIREVTVNLPLNEPIKWDNRFICTILEKQECSVVIAPLQKIPEFLRDNSCCPEIYYSLPVIYKDGKVLAYPYTNNEIKYIISCTIEKNLLKLTLS